MVKTTISWPIWCHHHFAETHLADDYFADDHLANEIFRRHSPMNHLADVHLVDGFFCRHSFGWMYFRPNIFNRKLGIWRIACHLADDHLADEFLHQHSFSQKAFNWWAFGRWDFGQWFFCRRIIWLTFIWSMDIFTDIILPEKPVDHFQIKSRGKSSSSTINKKQNHYNTGN